MSAQHADTITRMRLEGATTAEIAAATGLTRASVWTYAYRNRIPRAHRDPRAGISLPFGRISVSRLTNQEIQTLDDLAIKWGCDDLAEAMLEIVKDYLAEQAKRG